MGESSTEVCPECGAAVEVSVSQHVAYGGKLVWSRSFKCHQCGLAIEEDEAGFPPEPIRQHLLAAHGEWDVVLRGGISRTRVIKVLRATLGWDLKQAANYLRSATTTLSTGTEAEAHWIKHQLTTAGIEADVFRHQ